MASASVNCASAFIPNVLTTANVCHWLKRNIDSKSKELQEAVMVYLIRNPELVERYLAQNATGNQLYNWKNIKEGLCSHDDVQSPSPLDLTEDIVPIIDSEDPYSLFSKLSIVLQQAVRADRVQVEFAEQVTENLENTVCQLVDVQETNQNRTIILTISLSNNVSKAIVRVMRHGESQPFTDIERGVAVFISKSLATCFFLHQPESKGRKSDKGDSFLQAILPRSSNFGLEGDMITNVIHKILSHAQRLLSAERSTLFLLNEATNELVAEYFSLGNDVFTYNENVRCAIGEGFAGLAAATKKTLNIRDCYSDPRFKQNIDKITGYVTRNLISCPVLYCDKVIGVLEALNKIGSSAFTSADEKVGQSLTTYCSLALHLAKLQSKITIEQKKLDVAMEMLKYHRQAKQEDIVKLRERPYLRKPPPFIDEIYFDYTRFKKAELPRLFIHIFYLLFEKQNFPMEKMCSFIETVLINYRDVPYHNVLHAYNVAHSMYLMMKDVKHIFTITEMKTLIVACVCHDVDHRGYTNDYLVKTGSPLASLYHESVLENHHYQLTISILQEEQNDIFCDLSVEEHQELLDDLEPLVLATDISQFHINMAEVQELFGNNQFNIEEEESKSKLKRLLMIGCDLSAVCKPWPVYLKSIKNMYREFYAQGDEQRRMGEKLLAMMDRERQDCIPVDQVRFLDAVCVPCYRLIAEALPQTKGFLLGCAKTIEVWKEKQANGSLPDLDIDDEEKPPTENLQS